jgi:hypothetical protein
LTIVPISDTDVTNLAQLQDGRRVTPAAGASAVPAGGGSSPPSPGGSGKTPGRHHDRSARSSLDWDRPASGNAWSKPRPRKRVLELSGGVGSLPQAPRWNADRRARPSLPLPNKRERRKRSGRAAASADANGRFTRLSAFRLPDLRAGAIEMGPVPPPAAIRRDRVLNFSFFLEQNSGAGAPRERWMLLACRRRRVGEVRSE